jgi:hypothetical protein
VASCRLFDADQRVGCRTGVGAAPFRRDRSDPVRGSGVGRSSPSKLIAEMPRPRRSPTARLDRVVAADGGDRGRAGPRDAHGPPSRRRRGRPCRGSSTPTFVLGGEARGRTRDGPPEGRKTTQRAAPMRSGPRTGTMRPSASWDYPNDFRLIARSPSLAGRQSRGGPCSSERAASYSSVRNEMPARTAGVATAAAVAVTANRAAHRRRTRLIVSSSVDPVERDAGNDGRCRNGSRCRRRHT